MEDPDGDWRDAWYFEDRLIYVHKKFVAIPLSATPDGDVSKSDRTVMTFTATTYDEMRPGCYDPEARIRDFELNWADGSLPFPTFPRFCGHSGIRHSGIFMPPDGPHHSSTIQSLYALMQASPSSRSCAS